MAQPGRAAETRKDTAPAVARAARLLDLLAASRNPLRLADLAKSLGAPRSSVHGLCATLTEAGLIARYDDGTYHLGVRIMDLAHAYLARTDLTVEFMSIVSSTAPMPEDLIVLSVLDGADIVYVACRNGNRPFGFNFRVAMRLPANCAASGKALLSALPAERIVEFSRKRMFYALTRKSIISPEKLLKQLAQVRKQGYAIDQEETREGMVCIGAPVFGSTPGPALAAVAVSMPKSELNDSRKMLAIDTIKHISTTLSHRLGGR